jgi:hypothetical protein
MVKELLLVFGKTGWIVIPCLVFHLYVAWFIIWKKDILETETLIWKIISSVIFPVSLWKNYKKSLRGNQVLATILIFFFLFFVLEIIAMGQMFSFSLSHHLEAKIYRFLGHVLIWLIPITDLGVYSFRKYVSKVKLSDH